jgi:hypothetical protein
MKEIPLTQGMFAQVDDDWYEYLMQWKWFYRKNLKRNTGYAARTTWPERKQVHMHRVIMNTPLGQEVDHIDRNGCHNWQENMRNCEKGQNQMNQSKRSDNTSGFKGVSWHKQRQKWNAKIYIKGKHKSLGLYQTPEEAARAYDRAAEKFFREYAFLNFPEQELA